MEYNEVKRIVDLEERIGQLEIKIHEIERGIGNTNLSITRGDTIGEINNTYIDNTYEKPITKPSSKPFVNPSSEPISKPIPNTIIGGEIHGELLRNIGKGKGLGDNVTFAKPIVCVANT